MLPELTPPSLGPCDVTKKDDLENLYQELSKREKHINLLIAAAGISGEKAEPDTEKATDLKSNLQHRRHLRVLQRRRSASAAAGGNGNARPPLRIRHRDLVNVGHHEACTGSLQLQRGQGCDSAPDEIDVRRVPEDRH